MECMNPWEQKVLKLVEETPTYPGLIDSAAKAGWNEKDITETLKKGLQKRAEFWDRKANYEQKTNGDSSLYKNLLGRAKDVKECLSVLEKNGLKEYERCLIKSGARISA